MKLKILLIITLLISCCTADQPNKSNILSQNDTIADSIDDKEFIYKNGKYLEHTKRLTREELQHDVAVLIAVFERVYSGKDHLPLGAYEKLISDVRFIGEKLLLGTTENDGDQFCEHLASIFLDVPDNHLRTERSCRGKIKEPVTPDVGKNIHTGEGYFYEIRTIDRKRIGLLSLGTYMPDKKDRSWKGFEKKIANMSKKTDALIIDLRGNGGGMSDNIRWLASYLYGNPAKMVDEIGIMRESAAVCALFHNEATLNIIAAVKDKRPVQSYLVKEKKDALKEFKKFYKKESKQLRIVRKGSDAPFNPKKGYDKPIRILIDKSCVSACESGFARFLSHPQVKTYGTNTGGAYHYGDNKPLVLPKSNVLVSIPTSFREFTDDRFIEKTGYAPDVPISSGHDALEAALKEVTDHFRSLAPLNRL